MPGINIGIDLGTSTVQYFVDGKGVVLSEEVATASDSRTGKTISVGSKAYKMIGREPDSITVHRPVRDGIVSDFTAVQDLLRYHLQKICGNRIFKPNLVLCVPSDVTGLEKRVLLDIATASGAAKACLIDKPIAAALGAGVDYRKPRGIMVVDIGAGSTEIAVITMGGIAVNECIHIAGNTFDADIERYLRRERSISIGALTAEQIKKKVGCAYEREAEIAMLAKGKDYVTGMPTLFEITTTQVYHALQEHLEQIADAVLAVLSDASPELHADIYENGILLTGGSALLPGIECVIEAKAHVPVRVAHNPENCVARGIGVALKHMDVLMGSGYFFNAKDV